MRDRAEYSVVVLPDPVGPVTSTMPYGLRIARIRSCSALASNPNFVRSSVRFPLSRIRDRKSTRLNSSHDQISYAVFCLKKKKLNNPGTQHHERCTSELAVRSVR